MPVFFPKQLCNLKYNLFFYKIESLLEIYATAEEGGNIQENSHLKIPEISHPTDILWK